MASKYLKVLAPNMFQATNLLEPNMLESLTKISRFEPKRGAQMRDLQSCWNLSSGFPCGLCSKSLCCTCGKMINTYGDHAMTWTKHSKTPMHNNMKKLSVQTDKKMCMTVKLTTAELSVLCRHTKIYLPINQEGCDRSKTTNEKLLSRLYFFGKLILKNIWEMFT